MARQKSWTFSVEYLTIGCNENNLRRNSVIFAVPLNFYFRGGGQTIISTIEVVHSVAPTHPHTQMAPIPHSITSIADVTGKNYPYCTCSAG